LLKIQFAKKKRIQISELRDAKKPYFRNVDWNFSISHCYPYCVFVAKKNKIGVDIEKIQKIQFENIAKRVFNNYENKILNKSNNKLLMFYKIWTMKESLYKCIFPKKSNKLFLKYKNNCFRNKDFVVNFKIWKKYLISTCEKIN
jgi:phosphopantetheine--protein transferase-like protein